MSVVETNAVSLTVEWNPVETDGTAHFLNYSIVTEDGTLELVRFFNLLKAQNHSLQTSTEILSKVTLTAVSESARLILLRHRFVKYKYGSGVEPKLVCKAFCYNIRTCFITC